MGGGAGRKSTKVPEEGDCVTLRWLGDHAHCSRCKEKRWWKPCESKNFWDKLSPDKRERYRRGAAVVEIEMTDIRPSAADAAERIRQQLREEDEEICAVERVPEPDQHGARLGGLTGQVATAVLASRMEQIKAAKKRKSVDAAFELSQRKLTPACKAKWRAWLLKVPKHVKLTRSIWDAPNKKEIAMAHYYGLRRTGLTQEECAIARC
jgi:hypothetical protein